MIDHRQARLEAKEARVRRAAEAKEDRKVQEAQAASLVIPGDLELDLATLPRISGKKFIELVPRIEDERMLVLAAVLVGSAHARGLCAFTCIEGDAKSARTELRRHGKGSGRAGNRRALILCHLNAIEAVPPAEQSD